MKKYLYTFFTPSSARVVCVTVQLAALSSREKDGVFFFTTVFNDNRDFVVTLHHDKSIQRIHSSVRCRLQTMPVKNISLNC